MKVTDLMVGDWVNYKSPSSGKLRPIKIQNIYGCEFNCEVENWNIISGKSISDTEPIKLTEEILVKNGFKKENQTIDGDYCKYTLPMFVLNWCDTDGFWYQNGDITPNHVHELQHLLRLCGIEKELIID